MSRVPEFSPRDIALLNYLNAQGVATSDQLTREFFKSESRCRARIADLIRAGYVEGIPLTQGVNLVPSRLVDLKKRAEQLGKRWQQMKIYRLAPRNIGEDRFNTPLRDPIYWQHQVGLNDVLNFLQPLLPGGQFLSDPQSKREWSRYPMGNNEPIPDLVWRREDRKVSIAIEFERTGKSLSRYLDRIYRYSISKYQRILFIAYNPKIFETLCTASKDYPQIGITQDVHLQKVYVKFFGYQTINKFLSAARES